MRISITHRHLCAVLNTELERRTAKTPVRILDVGCGNGILIAFLQQQLAVLRPDIELEIHGFDVSDSDVQNPGFFDATRELLSRECPGVDWSRRLEMITTDAAWPYENGTFDFVVSNQVLEHVHDIDFVFGETRRVLAKDGVAVHLFPLKYVCYEWHVALPFAHWISGRDLLVSYVRFWNRLGVGKYRREKGKVSLDAYARYIADYLIYETNYRSAGDIYRAAKRARLRCAFRYCGEFYASKLRSLMGRPARQMYTVDRSALLDRLAFAITSFAASITVVLDKRNTAARDAS